MTSGVIRGGRGGRVTHSWKVWGKILEGRGKGGKSVGGGMEGKGMKISRGVFFCLLLFETTEICLGYTKMEISMGENQEMGNFLTLPTFDCTPGYAPENDISHAVMFEIGYYAIWSTNSRQ